VVQQIFADGITAVVDNAGVHTAAASVLPLSLFFPFRVACLVLRFLPLFEARRAKPAVRGAAHDGGAAEGAFAQLRFTSVLLLPRFFLKFVPFIAANDAVFCVWSARKELCSAYFAFDSVAQSCTSVAGPGSIPYRA
jgi:hypothetical protein